MKKFKNFFASKKPSDKGETLTVNTINSLREMVMKEEMLTKKQVYFETQMQAQFALARKYGLKNKRAALLALRRKKRFEQQLLQVDGTLTTIELQREALETAKNNVAVLQAMKVAASTLKEAQMHLDVDKVHDIMDEIAEQQEVAREISDAISNPIGFSSDVDESDLERELEELEQEELDRELLKVDPFPSTNSETTRQPVEPILDTADVLIPTTRTTVPKPNRNQTEEDKELEELAQWGSA